MHAPRPRGRPPHPDVLTTTEWRVLHLIRHGLRRRQIATLTGTSENAIKYHVANIASKLGVRGIVALREWPGLPADSLVRAGDGESADGRYLPGSPAPSPEDRRTASMTTAVALGALGQVSLLSRDIARTEAFYRDALGLTHQFTFGNLAFFDCAGVRLFVEAVEDSDWRPGSILYFRVEDIVGAVDAMTARGIRFDAPPHLIHRDDAGGWEEWMAFFADPDGNHLALMSHIVRAPAGA